MPAEQTTLPLKAFYLNTSTCWGSFSPLLPPKAGLSVTATYDGLPGAAPVRVTFK